MQLSRFCKCLERDGVTAVFHSLKPEPFFLSTEEWLNCLKGNINDEISQIMLQDKLLVSDPSVDDDSQKNIKLEYVDIKTSPILYLVLTKHCNLSCRYCFQYERHRKSITPLPFMTVDTAISGIDCFIRHLKQSDKSHKYKPQIFLYGGEPLLNWNVFCEAVKYIESMKGLDLPEDIEIITVTNGTSIRDKHARFMFEHGIRVAISIDGPKELNDKFRITTKGKGAFDQIERGLRTLQKYDVKTTLSITITPDIATRLVEVVHWAHYDMRVNAISFNMIGGESLGHVVKSKDWKQYNEIVTNELIEAFKLARELGLYEDRIARKAEGFINHMFTAADCAAVGNQIVVQPDGKIAYCHASDEYNIGSVFDPNYLIFNDPSLKNWNQSLPINNELGCQDCLAISTCGYGCFHHIQEMGGDTRKKRDEQYCLHNQRTFEFLIWDLFEKSQFSS